MAEAVCEPPEGRSVPAVNEARHGESHFQISARGQGLRCSQGRLSRKTQGQCQGLGLAASVTWVTVCTFGYQVLPQTPVWWHRTVQGKQSPGLLRVCCRQHGSQGPAQGSRPVGMAGAPGLFSNDSKIMLIWWPGSSIRHFKQEMGLHSQPLLLALTVSLWKENLITAIVSL